MTETKEPMAKMRKNQQIMVITTTAIVTLGPQIMGVQTQTIIA